MRVAISSTGTELSAEVSPMFGRCPYFILADTETLEARAIPNPAISASGGAGVQSSQMIVRQGVEAVIGVNVGPNALQVFMAAGIPVYQAEEGTVQQAIEALQAGQLAALGAPTVDKDFGKPGGASARGLGRGMGMGGGRGSGA